MDIDFIRKTCSKLPAVTEDVKWGHDLVFSVGARMFCVVSLEPPFSCSFKVEDEQFEEMVTRQGIIPAPYMARAKWVQATAGNQLGKKEWESHLLKSYELVKAKLTRKLRTELGI